MIFEGCQSKSRELSLEEKVCPRCGNLVEVFSIDTEVVCDRCGFVIYNGPLSCVQWCKYAKRCVGPEMYERMMRVVEEQKRKRRQTEASPDGKAAG